MSNLKFIQIGDSFNANGLNVVWLIIGLICRNQEPSGQRESVKSRNRCFLVLFRYRMWIRYMAAGKSFRCPCSDHVPAADL